MKVLFYSVKDYERPYLDGTLDQQSSLFYTERPLSIHTAELAKGYDVVSVFTNDDCSEEILVLLHEYGIKYITTRAAGHDNIDLKKSPIPRCKSRKRPSLFSLRNCRTCGHINLGIKQKVDNCRPASKKL